MIDDRWFSFVIRADGYRDVETRIDYGSLEDGPVKTISLGPIEMVPTLESVD